MNKISKIFSAFLMSVMALAMAFAASRCASGKKAQENQPPAIISTEAGTGGPAITITFTKGESFNHPLMAIWLEDSLGNYLETLYVAESIGKGVFQHGDKTTGHWMPGPIRRPAALPYWGHKRGIKADDGYFLPTPDHPVPDAITGPTPQGNFILNSKTGGNLPRFFKVLLEINQSWDWNSYWTNNKYPDDEQYKTSSQPAVVYECNVNMADLQKEYEMKPIGHSHYSGQDGNLYTDLSTLTSALSIAGKIVVRVSPSNN